MEIVSIFATPLAADELVLDNASLEEFCKNKVRQDEISAPLMEKSQSTFVDLSTPVLQPLLREAHIRFNELYKRMGCRENTRLDISKIWINVNNNNPIDVPHIHPDASFVGVYYVKGSGKATNGNLVLHTPVAPLQHCIHPNLIVQNNYFNCFAHEIIPVTGRLVLFPAWIMHNVMRNFEDTERISIAFDAVIVNC